MTATAFDEPSSVSISNEILAREGCGAQTTTELVSADPHTGRLVERLEPGFNLAVHGAATGYTADVKALLDRWRAGRTKVVSAGEHLRAIEDDLGDAAESEEWTSIRCRLEPVEGSIEIHLSHGDVQPANVIMSPYGLRLVDFERLGWRVAGYDIATFEDGVRWRHPQRAGGSAWIEAEQLRYRVLDAGWGHAASTYL